MTHFTSHHVAGPTTRNCSAPPGALEFAASPYAIAFFACALVLLLANGTPAQAQTSREYQLKSVFLYQFAQFTEWPADAFPSSNTPLVIGVLGPDPLGHSLEDTVRGEAIRGHPIVVQHYRRADEIKACHILFISQSAASHMDEIMKSLSGRPILTVADTDAPSTAGAIIRFSIENNKVRFRINQEAARTSHLMLSSRLLRLAEEPPP
jgi:hypothetical protein